MKNKPLIVTVLMTALSHSAGFAADVEHEQPPPAVDCSAGAQPLLSVADFDGSGTVDRSDMKLLIDNVFNHGYRALYDRNADGKLNYADFRLAAADIGKESTEFDREMVIYAHRFGHLQDVKDSTGLRIMGYEPFTGSLKGHGEHWGGEGLVAAVTGEARAAKHAIEGLNVPQNGQGVKALFWGQAAIPLFNDPAAEGGLSPLDFPEPNGAWMTERVQAFGGEPPTFTSSEDENWHTHAGLCITIQDLGNGPEPVLDQHTSFAECQALPDLSRTAENPISFWGNIWMLHMWLYDLNPNGLFANTHPCVDPDAPSEHEINRGREVPPFFQHHPG